MLDILGSEFSRIEKIVPAETHSKMGERQFFYDSEDCVQLCSDTPGCRFASYHWVTGSCDRYDLIEKVKVETKHEYCEYMTGEAG